MKTPPNNCCGRVCCSLNIHHGAALRIGPPVRPSIHSPASRSQTFPAMSWSLISSASAIWPPIVYNTFPWPKPTVKRQSAIETTAHVLDARSQFPATTLADLYAPLIMPPVLLAAHQQLDRDVDAACIWASVASPLLPMPSGEPSCSSATSSLSGKSCFS